MQNPSRGASLRPSYVKPLPRSHEEDSPSSITPRAGGAPKRRISNPRLRGAAAHLAIGALAFRRSTAALVAATERFDSAQAALHAESRTRELSAPPIALKRCTSRAGRDAGGDDARTARERGYKPRPQEPPRSAIRCVSRSRPLDERDVFKVTRSATNVKKLSVSVTFNSTRDISLFHTASADPGLPNSLSAHQE